MTCRNILRDMMSWKIIIFQDPFTTPSQYNHSDANYSIKSIFQSNLGGPYRAQRHSQVHSLVSSNSGFGVWLGRRGGISYKGKIM
jgi:hypothetical protein